MLVHSGNFQEKQKQMKRLARTGLESTAASLRACLVASSDVFDGNGSGSLHCLFSLAYDAVLSCFETRPVIGERKSQVLFTCRG